MSGLDSMYEHRYERPTPKKICECNECGDNIYIGDAYWEIEDKTYCEDCINEFKKDGGENE